MRISEMLTAIAAWLESPDNEAILLSEYNDECLKVAAQGCVEAAFILRNAAEEVEAIEPQPESNLTAEALDELAELATSFDESDDENLKRTASVLDELLLTIAAPPSYAASFKEAEDRKIDGLRQQYESPSEVLEEVNKVADAKKDIENSPYNKEYRIMEHSLSTRGCPDHAGAQMARVGEGMWQCDLDKKVYNYQAGYTDEKGNKVPGGDVAAQTPNDRPEAHSIFDTRESRLNGYQR